MSPYGVLVSEIMLQQTQVDRVIPFYQRWMRRFPDFFSLAAASLEEVLLHWEGLGYYARARNLHSLAVLVCEHHGGELPESREDLMKLPGIGPYTSAAVMCIAFGKAEPAVDANAARVYARMEDIEEPPKSSGGRKRIEEAAKRLLAGGPPGELTQAVMELGALVCRSRVPDCRECPLSGLCRARSRGSQSMRPVTEKDKRVVRVLAAAAVIFRKQRVLLYRRPPEGPWGGLWGFPAGEFRGGETSAEAAARAAELICGVKVTAFEELGVFTHSYMSRRVTLHALCCKAGEGASPAGGSCRWVPLSSLGEYPLDAGSRKVAKALRRWPGSL
ncbi:MAG: A/G-specific adenine glycosylase [Thermovirgaceae bacterium]